MTLADADLADACAQAGLSPADAQPLRQHATAVLLLPQEHVVARVSIGAGDVTTAQRALTVCRWYAEHGVPVTAPAYSEAITAPSGTVVTFWRFYPQGERERPPTAALGAILRELHAAPAPPTDLPEFTPLAQLRQLLSSTAGALPATDQAWLEERAAALVDAYGDLVTELGVGVVHGDAYPGNLLWDGDRVLLGDWDETAIAPREVDLVNTYQGVRFGRSTAELAEFATAYGWDVASWRGFETLRETRDLHTLGSFLRRAADGDATAAAELRHRVASLRAGAAGTRWHAA